MQAGIQISVCDEGVERSGKMYKNIQGRLLEFVESRVELFVNKVPTSYLHDGVGAGDFRVESVLTMTSSF